MRQLTENEIRRFYDHYRTMETISRGYHRAADRAGFELFLCWSPLCFLALYCTHDRWCRLAPVTQSTRARAPWLAACQDAASNLGALVGARRVSLSCGVSDVIA